MKHAIGALLTLTAILLLCLYLMTSVDRVVSETYELIQKAADSAEINTVASTLRQANRLWQSSESLLGAVLQHDAMEEVGDDISGLIAYALQDDWSEFYGTCAKLLANLSHIRQKEYPLFRNIM